MVMSPNNALHWAVMYGRQPQIFEFFNGGKHMIIRYTRIPTDEYTAQNVVQLSSAADNPNTIRVDLFVSGRDDEKSCPYTVAMIQLQAGAFFSVLVLDGIATKDNQKQHKNEIRLLLDLLKKNKMSFFSTPPAPITSTEDAEQAALKLVELATDHSRRLDSADAVNMFLSLL